MEQADEIARFSTSVFERRREQEAETSDTIGGQFLHWLYNPSANGWYETNKKRLPDT
jgi:hypothetical protein